MIKVNYLMDIERILLEINDKYKFDLPFNEQYQVHYFLKIIGDITDYFFEIQNTFYGEIKNQDELQNYHDKMMNEEIEFDTTNVLKLIDKLLEEINDEELKKLRENL